VAKRARHEVVPRPSALEPYVLTTVEEHPRNRDKQDTQKGEERRRPLVTHFGIHLLCEKRKARADDVSDENDTCQGRCGVGLVAVDDVVEDREDDDEDAGTEE